MFFFLFFGLIDKLQMQLTLAITNNCHFVARNKSEKCHYNMKNKMIKFLILFINYIFFKNIFRIYK